MKHYIIMFKTADLPVDEQYPIYFTRYAKAKESGHADMVHFRDSSLYAKKFRSEDAAKRMFDKIRKNLESGKAKSVLVLGKGEVWGVDREETGGYGND